MICIEVIETGERRCIENEVWITENRNGIHRTPHRSKALGIGDGETVWSLGKLEGYPAAKLITLAEYLESLGEQGEAEPEEPEATAEDFIAALAEMGVTV